MSAGKFSKYIQSRLAPRILKKSAQQIRRITDTRINLIRFSEKDIPKFQKRYDWDEETAKAALNFIIQKAESSADLVRETDPKIVGTNKNVYRPAVKKGTRVKNQYKVIQKFKTQLGKDFAENPKFTAAKNFGSDFHAGHGVSSFSVVHYLGLEAARDVGKFAGTGSLAYKDFANGLQNLFEEQQVRPGHKIDISGSIKQAYGKGRTFRRDYTVYLDLQVAEENLQDATDFERNFDKAVVELLEEVAARWPGSKPALYEISDDILESAKGKKVKGTVNKTGRTGKINISKSKEKKTVKKGTAGSATKMRTARGQFTSPIALMNLINARLHDVIRKNMGSPALNYRTGRFARSVKITNISQTRQQQMTAFYTYMKSPYQTFERGYAQGSPRRDPRTLISKSIRDAAAQIMGRRFDIRTRRQ